VQCLKSVGTANPLVLIDEIDKVLLTTVYGPFGLILLEMLKSLHSLYLHNGL
jgi:ATP-dependent Lon protease